MTSPTCTVLQGRYRVLDTRGRGGMGQVYRAENLMLSRPCAVKEMLAPFTPDPEEKARLAEAFRAEARILASLDHEALPRVHDFFEESGRFYLVMDFIDGETLEQVAAACGGSVPEPVVVGWMASLLDVLEYLHSRRPPIIFRDLKPENCMRAASGRIQLIDFGIAKLFCPDARTSPLLRQMGTPGYAAPEQYGSGPTDARSDLYSLGATVYRLLAGQPPPEPAARAAGVPLPRLREIDPGLSPALDYAVDRMLRLAPAERPTGVAAIRLLLKMGRAGESRHELEPKATPPPALIPTPAPSRSPRPRTRRIVRTATISPSWIESRRRAAPAPPPPAPLPPRPARMGRWLRSVAWLALGVMLAVVVGGAADDAGPLGQISRLCYSLAAPISTPVDAAPASPRPPLPAPDVADAPAASAASAPAAASPSPLAAAPATPSTPTPEATENAPPAAAPPLPPQPVVPPTTTAAAQAHLAAAAGRHALAVRLFRRALSRHPADANLWDDLGLSLDWLQRADESLAAYQRAVALAPGNPTFLAHLGSAWARRGEVSRGLVLCQRAVAMAPRDASILNDLALSWDAAGNSAAAVVALRAALREAPEDRVLWANLARLYHKLGDEAAAQVCYRRAATR